MARIMSKENVSAFLKKYKFVVLIFAIGIFLMLIPNSKTESTSNTDIIEEKDNILSIEDQLGVILSHVKGAGEVHVMLSLANGEETLYQTNQDISSTSDNSTTRVDTVTITDANRNETGLIRQINPPTYMGAIVVCQGADSPVVRLSIIEAVSKVTGLGADKISVLKMK